MGAFERIFGKSPRQVAAEQHEAERQEAERILRERQQKAEPWIGRLIMVTNFVGNAKDAERVVSAIETDTAISKKDKTYFSVVASANRLELDNLHTLRMSADGIKGEMTERGYRCGGSVIVAPRRASLDTLWGIADVHQSREIYFDESDNKKIGHIAVVSAVDPEVELQTGAGYGDLLDGSAYVLRGYSEAGAEWGRISGRGDSTSEN